MGLDTFAMRFGRHTLHLSGQHIQRYFFTRSYKVLIRFVVTGIYNTAIVTATTALMPYCAVEPPSMTNSLPVTNDDSSEAR